MSNYPPGRAPRPADPYPGLRLAALIAVILGVALLAAAAFALSYAGIHEIALRAGVSPGVARLYPVIFDAMVVISGAAAVALRGAGWWARAYAWSSLLLMLAVVAIGDALHATNVSLPAQPTRAVVAVTPWVLLLIAFGLWLEMLRYFRRVRAASASQARTAGPAPVASAWPAPAASAVPAPGPPGQLEQAGQTADGGATSSAAGDGASTGAQRAAVTWASAGDVGVGRSVPQPPEGLDLILGPREENPPAMTVPGPGPGAAAAYPGQVGQRETAQYPEQVSYGEETGYVHPDSYQGQAGHPDYPGHGAYGGWITQLPAPHQAESTALHPSESTAPHPSESTALPPPEDTAPHPGEATAPPPAEDTAPPPAEDTTLHQAEDTASHPAEDSAPPPAKDTAPPPPEATAPPPAEATAPPSAEDTTLHQAEDAASHPAGDSTPPPAEDTAPHPAGDAAEPGPAADQHAPGPDGDGAAQMPAANPTLDRLRSTPALPED